MLDINNRSPFLAQSPFVRMGRFSGRRSGPYITLAIGQSLPALLAVEAGDALSAAVPPGALDPDLFRVVGDDSDEVIDVILEWRLTRDGVTEDWKYDDVPRQHLWNI